jgi:hypothetical protein
VADDLVDQVGLRRVERRRRVADVLRRVELEVLQRAVELLHRDDARGRHVVETRQRREPVGDLVELRDAIHRQVERRLRLEERLAGVPGVLRRQLALDRAPHLLLLLGVGDLRDRPSAPPLERRGRDLVSPLLVDRVGLARVVVRQVDGHRAVLGLGDRGVELCLLEHRCSSRYPVVDSATGDGASSRHEYA